jgi:hypothetical protein
MEILRFLAMIGLYAATVTVCVGVVLMTPEACMSDQAAAKAMWEDGPPPVSAALACTMNLTIQFFAVYLVYNITKTVFEQLDSRGGMKWKAAKMAMPILDVILETLKLATDTVKFAPMLCILFIGARMRALQMDPVNGSPQPWAKMCFYVCTYALLAQTILVLLTMIPALGAKVEDGEVHLEGAAGKVVQVFQLVTMICIYGGFTAVIISILTITDKDGASPPLSPTMQCVMNLTIQFFAVNLFLFIVKRAIMFAPESVRHHLHSMSDILTSMQETCAFCPMLSILFIGTRMRALEMTKQKGQPPGYVQDAMFASTTAVLIQLILCLFQKVPVTIVQALAGMLDLLAKALLYGGIIVIMVGLRVMTPQICDGKGSYVKDTFYDDKAE